MGNKYGFRPIPSTIPHEVFTALSDAFGQKAEWSLVTEWYKCDENAIPPVYVLQIINSKIANYSSVS